MNSSEHLTKLAKVGKTSSGFQYKIKLRERCKGVHFVDLGESFPTHIYLQRFGFDTAENEPFKVRELDS